MKLIVRNSVTSVLIHTLFLFAHYPLYKHTTTKVMEREAGGFFLNILLWPKINITYYRVNFSDVNLLKTYYLLIIHLISIILIIFSNINITSQTWMNWRLIDYNQLSKSVKVFYEDCKGRLRNELLNLLWNSIKYRIKHSNEWDWNPRLNCNNCTYIETFKKIISIQKLQWNVWLL